MKKILALYTLVFGLVGCCHNDDPEDPLAERAVLIYMAAENNLSSFADSDLLEMKTGSRLLNDKQQLIAYIDRADTIPPYFARIKDGQFVDSISMKESLTADPAILEMALRYLRTNYPAKSYGLVLWGHGSGWLVSNDSIAYSPSRAYGGDTGNGSSSSSGKYWMNIPSMAKAIDKGMGGTPLTFIMGDCCCFGCIEVAYELRHTADYILGSPAEVPDDGAPFDKIVPSLFNTETNFYKTILSNYYNFYLEAFQSKPGKYYNRTSGDLQGYSVPLVAVQTSELENLGKATAQLCSTIQDKLTPTGDLDFNGKLYYAMYGSNRYSYDMYNMLKNNTSESDFKNWSAAFWKAVPYRTTSNRWLTNYTQLGSDMLSFEFSADDCGVLSMFFPRTIYSSTKPSWNSAINHFQWDEAIRWQDYGW